MRMMLLALVSLASCAAVSTEEKIGESEQEIIQPIEEWHPKSGHRIRVRYWLGADGSETFASMYDELHAVAVGPMMDPAMTPRMYPLASVAQLAGYSDPLCSVQIAAVPTGANVPRFVLRWTTAPSGDMLSVLEIRELEQPHSGPVYTVSGGQCSPTSQPGAVYYTVGPVLGPSKFVPLTEHIQ